MVPAPDSPLPGPDGDATRQSLLDTIDALGASERALRQREALLELAGSVARIGSWNFELANNALTWSEITYVLHEVEHRRPPTVEEAITFYHPEDRPRITAAVERALAGGGDYDGEFRIITAKGSERWVRTIGRVFVEHGRPVRLGGIFQDIDAQKRAALALAEADARWRFALDGAGHGVWDWRVETGEMFFSPQGKALLGYGDHEIGTTIEAWKALAHPDDLPAAEAALRAHFEGRSDVYACEHRMRCKDGTWKWILARGQVIEWHAPGQPRRMIGTHTDIDKLRQAQSRLAETSARLGELIDSVEGIVWVADAATLRFTFVSTQAEAILGYPLARWQEETFWSDHIHPDDREHAVNFCAEETNCGRNHRLEYRMIAADGRAVWLQDMVSLVRGDDGRVRTLRGLMVDITVAKEAQARLAASEARFRQIFDFAPDSIFLVSAEPENRGAILDANESAAFQHGYTREELRGMNIADLDEPEDERLAPERIRRILEEGIGRFEVMHRSKDGLTFPVEVTAGVNVIDGRKVILSINRDITARRAAQAHERELVGRLEMALRVADLGVFRRNLRNGVGDWDARVREIYGLAADAPAPTPAELEEIVFPEDRQEFFRQHHNSGEGMQHRFRIRRADGDVRHVESRSLIVCSEDGRPEWLVGTARDLTETVRQTQALAASEQLRREEARRLELTLEATGVGTWRYNFHTGEAQWDAQTCRFFGFAATPPYEEFLARVHPDDRAEVEASRAAISRGERTFRENFRVRRPDGTVIHVQSQGSLETDAQGRHEWVTGIILDVTQRVEAEQARRQLEAQLLHTQKMETLGSMAGGIAHDFNNLLTGILGFIELAQFDVPRGTETASHLARAQAGCLKSRDLVKRLLLFARRAPGAKKNLVHLPNVIAETTALLSSTMPASISLRTELASDLPRVLGDEGQLHQVLMNLCVNAAQAIGTKPGAIRLELRTEGTADGAAQLVLTVGDNGCGMDAETAARVFEPFFTTKKIGEGSGLGLAIVHGIVLDHGGTISVATAPGAGTVFTVRLPAAPAEEHPAAATPVAGGGSRAATSVGRGRRVLLVEDDESVRRFVCTVLERAGFVAEFCVDGLDGSRRIAAGIGQLHLAVLDLTMPGKSGIELLRELRLVRTDLPVLMMSGDPERYGSSQWPEFPNLKRITKPFSEEELLTAATTLLNGNAPR